MEAERFDFFCQPGSGSQRVLVCCGLRGSATSNRSSRTDPASCRSLRLLRGDGVEERETNEKGGGVNVTQERPRKRPLDQESGV